jgi:hypothetical protein
MSSTISLIFVFYPLILLPLGTHSTSMEQLEVNYFAQILIKS